MASASKPPPPMPTVPIQRPDGQMDPAWVEYLMAITRIIRILQSEV